MDYEAGKWIVYGVEEGDPECISSVEEAAAYISEIGFLPLFKNDIPGFSLEERTVAENWWTGDPARDPWEWREVIARSGDIIYGKFFDKKAGFISREWFPFFVNYRRDGYDFDALWDDEKASMRQKKIMDLFGEDTELYSFEVKANAGFGKDGEKNFEGTITNLQMQTYLCMSDFRQKRNKSGNAYGMAVAVYSMPEHIWGYEHTTSAYREEPLESGKRIMKHMMDIYPAATPRQIRKVIGCSVSAEKDIVKEKVVKKPDYPANLIKALGMDMDRLSNDQLVGLEYALGLLKEKDQEYLSLRFKMGYTHKQIGECLNRSSGGSSHKIRTALNRLKNPRRICWILEGYEGRRERLGRIIQETEKMFLAEEKYEQAEMLYDPPEKVCGITPNWSRILEKAGVWNVGVLRELLKEDFWTNGIYGIGDQNGKSIVQGMYFAGLIDKDFEAYKEANDRTYYLSKVRQKRMESEEE